MAKQFYYPENLIRSRFFRLFFMTVLIIVNACIIEAKNLVTHSGEGLIFTAYTERFVYAPEDNLSISYDITNVEHLRIVIPFPSASKRSQITVETPSGITGTDLFGDFDVITSEWIKQDSTLHAGFSTSLSSFRVIRNDTIRTEMGSVADGDTLRITAKSIARNFGIVAIGTQYQSLNEVYGVLSPLALSFNDAVQIFQHNYSVTPRSLPSNATFTITVFIRKKTADINRDGQINLTDLSNFRQSFGAKFNNQHYNVKSDLNGDGRIDFSDFLIFVTYFQNQQ